MSTQSQQPKLRQPIVVVLGHVDHGKTSLLDKIRSTAVAAKEAGGITQHIGASIVPADVIEKLAEPLRKLIPIKLSIPGLLFIDTPGHELFSNLRKRGGSVADFAILVVDVTKGFQNQTYESLDLLRSRKVPFLVAANKIDRIPGWTSYPDEPFIISYERQSEEAKRNLEEVIYGKIVLSLSEQGFSADLFTRIKDFTKTVAVVPVSAKTGEGIPDLLAVLAGLTQQYLKKRLQYAEGPAKGSILEVKEIPGLGTVVDAIIYDGVIKEGDTIVLNGKNGPIITTVRSLLMPAPLSDMRAKGVKFVSVPEVQAAAGVRIAASGLDDALAGSSLYVATSPDEAKEIAEKLRGEVKELIFKGDNVGVIVKADTLGTLEALLEALRRLNVPVKSADVGNVSKNDVLEASLTAKADKSLGVILAFNVKVLPEAEQEAARSGVKIFSDNIIYHLLDQYTEWRERLKEEEINAQLNQLVRPGKFMILPGFVFRRSDPVIVGIEVLGGVVRPGYPLISSKGREVGRVLAIKDNDKSLDVVRTGARVAISIEGKVMVGRQIDEGDIVYTDVPVDHAIKLLTDFRKFISDDEVIVLKEIAELKKKLGQKEYVVVLNRLGS
ncbi:Probable translation initiation factor IF-2 [Acidilobus saccharovorans 345-15]|uniref:Probable translation initiation factor IF-2 n=1 Tax=Acidilobus saccharovorans (strain DSM 16705 / JCM 18335 / VKM B-2471 / 345-15) TaxID=666510 RepID=D9Q2G1_ACIS3|nr:translation initiation factor IF-2 [Acidilobus saccharovorans]ADL19499.1 Probable translation initiation factor IF-2 [Acidilobus saccharovorans 345-15]